MEQGFYGDVDSSNDVMTVQERCRDYYKIGTFVVIMNIDTSPFVYQVQREANQSVSDDGVSQTIINVKPPERITLQPGQTRLVPAYEADLMIKALIDKIVNANRSKDLSDEKTPRESVMDPQTQKKYIALIYQGQKDFLTDYNSDKPIDDLAVDYKAEAEKLRSEIRELKKEKDEPTEPAKQLTGRPAK